MFKPLAGLGSVLAIILSTQTALGADATDYAQQAAAGETSAAQIVEDALKRATEKEALNAFIHHRRRRRTRRCRKGRQGRRTRPALRDRHRGKRQFRLGRRRHQCGNAGAEGLGAGS